MKQVIQSARSVFAAVNAEREQQGLYWKELSAKCGVAWETMKGWNSRSGARVDCIVDALDALGLELVIRRKGETGE
ncbi:MAG: hypothetical protein IKH30_01575 [Clostridia bacterium]|nr:hypothetical protein [Clostridia bacterium]MBR4537236.1 hypothetical protein [Clostridia bacterium]MBR4540533.1 hypothetical protein [Clostridia bacterium]